MLDSASDQAGQALALTQPSLSPTPAQADAGLREALTPSAETKAAYIGEFGFNIVDRDEDGDEVYRRVLVPWDTIKKVMAAILARAALAEQVRCDRPAISEQIADSRERPATFASGSATSLPAREEEREAIARIVEGCCQSMESGGGHCDQYDAADAILARLTPGGIPDGWRLVPVEPTEEMIDRFVSRALCVSVHGDGGWSNYAREQWSAMLAASPSLKRGEVGS